MNEYGVLTPQNKQKDIISQSGKKKKKNKKSGIFRIYKALENQKYKSKKINENGFLTPQKKKKKINSQSGKKKKKNQICGIFSMSKALDCSMFAIPLEMNLKTRHVDEEMSLNQCNSAIK